MDFLKLLKTTKEKVKYYLKNYPHLRDNDYELIANFWYYEEKDNATITAKEFLRRLAKGKYTHSESIRRVRATLQEECPELRGERYKERMEDGENVAKHIHEL